MFFKFLSALYNVLGALQIAKDIICVLNCSLRKGRRNHLVQ